MNLQGELQFATKRIHNNIFTVLGLFTKEMYLSIYIFSSLHKNAAIV